LGADGELVTAARGANTALEVLQRATATGVDIASVVVDRARVTAVEVLGDAEVVVDVVVVDREGEIIARSSTAQ
jgi:cobalt-precorrin-5B (C1)-methyltransferase